MFLSLAGGLTFSCEYLNLLFAFKVYGGRGTKFAFLQSTKLQLQTTTERSGLILQLLIGVSEGFSVVNLEKKVFLARNTYSVTIRNVSRFPFFSTRKFLFSQHICQLS